MPSNEPPPSAPSFTRFSPGDREFIASQLTSVGFTSSYAAGVAELLDVAVFIESGGIVLPGEIEGELRLWREVLERVSALAPFFRGRPSSHTVERDFRQGCVSIIRYAKERLAELEFLLPPPRPHRPAKWYPAFDRVLLVLYFGAFKHLFVGRWLDARSKAALVEVAARLESAFFGDGAFDIGFTECKDWFRDIVRGLDRWKAFDVPAHPYIVGYLELLPPGGALVTPVTEVGPKGGHFCETTSGHLLEDVVRVSRLSSQHANPERVPGPYAQVADLLEQIRDRVRAGIDDQVRFPHLSETSRARMRITLDWMLGDVAGEMLAVIAQQEKEKG